MKYNFGEKKKLNRKNNATETENTKKKKKKLKQSCHTSHNTKLKGTWEESYFAGTCESSEMHI